MAVHPQTYGIKEANGKNFDAHSPHEESKLEMPMKRQVWATYVHQLVHQKGRPFEHKRAWLDESPNHHENG